MGFEQLLGGERIKFVQVMLGRALDTAMLEIISPAIRTGLVLA